MKKGPDISQRRHGLVKQRKGKVNYIKNWNGRIFCILFCIEELLNCSTSEFRQLTRASLSNYKLTKNFDVDDK